MDISDYYIINRDMIHLSITRDIKSNCSVCKNANKFDEIVTKGLFVRKEQANTVDRFNIMDDCSLDCFRDNDFREFRVKSF